MALELGTQVAEIEAAVAVLADRDHVRGRFAPRQLVRVVLERPHEDNRPRAPAELRTRMSRSIAAVAPDPQKTTTSSSPPPTARWTIRRASSRRRVVCRPVAEASLWVFAYRGSTESRMTSSTKSRERPDAVQSA